MRLVLPPDLKPHSFLTLEEAADLLHVKVRWMRAAIEENRIGHYKIGRLVRIQVTDLFAYVAAGASPSRHSYRPCPACPLAEPPRVGAGGGVQ